MISWVVGFWRADHGGREVEVGSELRRWLKPFLDRLGHKAPAADVSAYISD